MEKFIYKGAWQIPGNNNCLVGDLSFDNENGLQLSLIGKFEKNDQFSIIHGRTTCGKVITLVNSCRIGGTFNSHGYDTTIIKSMLGFVGILFETVESIKLDNLYINFSNLENWFWPHNIHVDDYNISLNNKDESIDVSIDDNYSVGFYSQYNYPIYEIVQTSASISQKVYAKIRSKELVSFDELQTKLMYIRNFISLGIGYPVNTLDMFTYVQSSEIKIYYTQIMNKSKNIYPLEMLFNYKDIQNGIENYIKNWYNQYEILEPIFNLYFSNIFNPDLYIQNKFLSYVQTLEAYHRRTYTMNDKNMEKHSKKIEEIKSYIDNEEYVEWLEKKLKYSHEPSLFKRLKLMTKECTKYVNLNIENVGDFIKEITTTRNYLTHYDKSLEGESIKPDEMLNTCRNLKIIIEFYLLKEIKFPLEVIGTIINKKYRLNDKEEIKNSLNTLIKELNQE